PVNQWTADQPRAPHDEDLHWPFSWCTTGTDNLNRFIESRAKTPSRKASGDSICDFAALRLGAKCIKWK
ncbi:MAG TPA: hypothetical protein VKI65_06895, partial [Gemmataceae bacterium]|nr:hypothetical protein [Gemmataceae bacterium]